MTDISNFAPKYKSDRLKEATNDLVFSYITMRNLIGLCGMLLPFILIFFTNRNLGDRLIEPSISHYYYTSNGDVLVVLLSVLGVFLFSYKGYCWKETALSWLAAVCGIGVAFSPTASSEITSLYSIHVDHKFVPMVLGKIPRHLVFAGIFFICLAIISLVYFPRSDQERVTGLKLTAKAKRNRVYIICGWVMLIAVLSISTYFLNKTLQQNLGDFPFVFVCETIAVEAFGLSWLTKGETLWPDGEHYLVRGWREVKNVIRQKSPVKKSMEQVNIE